MMKRIGLSIVTILFLSSLYSLAFADASEKLPINNEGFFVGIGGNYSTVDVDARLSGALNAVSGFPPTGAFSGTEGSYNSTRHVFAPEGQLGYFHQFVSSDWMWGGKFLYQYLNAKHTANNVSINYVSTANISNQVTGSVQTNVEHELGALAFIGRSFTNGFVYLGVGPSLFQVQNKIFNLNDRLSGNYIGNLNNASSSSKWEVGGIIQAGVDYYFSSTWFMDVNYTYAQVGRYASNESGSYSPANNGGLNAGTISFDTSKRVTAQGLIVSVNKVFL